jgi:hypothetical protein
LGVEIGEWQKRGTNSQKTPATGRTTFYEKWQ